MTRWTLLTFHSKEQSFCVDQARLSARLRGDLKVKGGRTPLWHFRAGLVFEVGIQSEFLVDMSGLCLRVNFRVKSGQNSFKIFAAISTPSCIPSLDTPSLAVRLLT